MTEIITRAEWGARLPTSPLYYPPFPVAFTFCHHTVGAGTVDADRDGDFGDDYMRQTQRFHQDGRGWKDIAYNFLIDPVGLEIYEGRGWGAAPGAQCSFNVGTWAVAIMGDFRKITPAPALKARIAELVVYGQEIGELPDFNPLEGHRDAPVVGDCSGTTCPGTNLYAALPEINQLIQEGLDMPLTDEDIEKVAERAAAHVWGGYEIQGRHANTILRDINGDTDFLRSQSVKTMTEAQLQAVATAVADELHRRGAE